jgi:hypothetical protein
MDDAGFAPVLTSSKIYAVPQRQRLVLLTLTTNFVNTVIAVAGPSGPPSASRHEDARDVASQIRGQAG